MSTFEREAFIAVPSNECPFCGPDRMQSGWDYIPAEPSEYYYRCTCGAGEDDRAYPDDFGEDDDGTPITHWVIAESQIDDLLPQWRENAKAYLAEQDDES